MFSVRFGTRPEEDPPGHLPTTFSRPKHRRHFGTMQRVRRAASAQRVDRGANRAFRIDSLAVSETLVHEKNTTPNSHGNRRFHASNSW